MKKKIFVNPAIYAVFILAVVGSVKLIERLVTTKEYVNSSQEIASYFFTAAMLFAVYWIGKDIIRPIPLSYDNNEIIIKRYFKNDITLNYKDIVKAEYYNRYMRLIIHAKDKKYKFSFVMNTSEFKKVLSKKVKNTDF
ncbi:MAG TPA: hypothetical protein DEP70_09270 [Acholeplasmataceae bacterium]|nr:hypothetical protein [Acholeplasmataceae bacterium]